MHLTHHNTKLHGISFHISLCSPIYMFTSSYPYSELLGPTTWCDRVGIFGGTAGERCS